MVRDGHNGYTIQSEDLYIQDNRILRIGSCPTAGVGFQVIDARGQLIMPGLVNMHTHAYMSVLKSYADDVPFDEWLFKRVMPVEDSLSPEAAYWSSLLACVEMVKTGTTCFVDMHMFRGQSCRAATDLGMRAFIGRGLVGEDLYADGHSRYLEALGEKEEYQSPLLQFVLSPHAIYSCSEKLLRQVHEAAREQGWLKQIHLSESDFETQTALGKYGKTPVAYLDDLGFLDENTILAHCVKVSEQDMERICARGATVVTNPASNAKLGNGIAPVPAMLDKGINVCIGTDSVASNNTLNLFREMGLLSLLHKGACGDASLLPAPCVLDMATVNAARGLHSDLGVIAEGVLADLIFVDLDAASLFPNNNILSSLCYCANGSEVLSVMVDGEFVMKDRQMLTVDTDRLHFEIRKIADRYL